MSDFSGDPEERSGLEPELGGVHRDAPSRSGLEPELGGFIPTEGWFMLMKSLVSAVNTASM